MVQDHRHDDLFLILKVPAQQLPEPQKISVKATDLFMRRVAVIGRPQNRVGAFGKPVQHTIHRVVIAVQNLKPSGQTGIHTRKCWKIV